MGERRSIRETRQEECVVPMQLRLLLSFHYYKEMNLDALFAKYFTSPYPEVFLDSGAFSAMTRGATIDLEAYCLFITRFGHLITTYANLDVMYPCLKARGLCLPSRQLCSPKDTA